MSFVIVLMGLMIAGDLIWWARARTWARQRGRGVKLAVAGWALLNVLVLLGAIFGRALSPTADMLIPQPLLALSFIWHLLVLPFTLVLMSGEGIVRSVVGLFHLTFGRQKPQPAPAEGPTERANTGELVLSRRSLLGATIATVPPLVTVLTTGRSIAMLDDFRIRRIDIPLANLPRDLNGLSIAHVTDVHVGRFTTATILPKIAEATNKLRADLVLMTGDLINISINDLPAGLDMVRRMDARKGLYTCEGNHDLIDNPGRFEREVKASGIPLLLDETAPINVNGHPVDLLGLRWARNRIGSFPDALARMNAARSPDAFAILLAHHPHAFDQAAASGIPLTLAGHTHGGQMRLSETLGFGPIMYKYWSGLYRKPEHNNAALVVSNGVGNWFPLRINTPAEIIHVVLHRA